MWVFSRFRATLLTARSSSLLCYRVFSVVAICCCIFDLGCRNRGYLQICARYLDPAHPLDCIGYVRLKSGGYLLTKSGTVLGFIISYRVSPLACDFLYTDHSLRLLPRLRDTMKGVVIGAQSSITHVP